MAAYCFAWDQNNRGVWGCKATTIDCNGMDESCPFYKTVERHRADRVAADADAHTAAVIERNLRRGGHKRRRGQR